MNTSFTILNDFSKLTPSLDKINYSNKEITEAKYNFDLLKRFKTENIILVHEVSIYTDVEAIKAQLSSNFDNLTDFKIFYLSIILIFTHIEILSWLDIWCSCYYFAKNKKCCHVYAYLKQNGKLNLVEINILCLKKKRGRPKKIGRGLGLKKEEEKNKLI